MPRRTPRRRSRATRARARTTLPPKLSCRRACARFLTLRRTALAQGIRKSLDGAAYSYCYYNCRKTLRAGKKACPGFRVRVEDLDGAVLAAIADVVCTPERAGTLAHRHDWPPIAEVIAAWRNFILRDHAIGRTYALHMIDHVEVHAERVVIVPKVVGGRKDLAMLGAAE